MLFSKPVLIKKTLRAGQHNTPFKGTGCHWFFRVIVPGFAGDDPLRDLKFTLRLRLAVTRSIGHYLPYLKDPKFFSEGRGAAHTFVTESCENLCAFLRITAEDATERWQDRGECSAMVCPNRPRDDVKIKQCKGCKKIRYCSVECQKV